MIRLVTVKPQCDCAFTEMGVVTLKKLKVVLMLVVNETLLNSFVDSFKIFDSKTYSRKSVSKGIVLIMSSEVLFHNLAVPAKLRLLWRRCFRI